MIPRFGHAALALLVAVSLSACGARQKTPDLINIDRGQTSPDEFAILPSKPIEIPERLDELPPPQIGGTNRTDPTPKGDAVAALGGNPSRLQPNGVPRADGALMSATGRFGTRAQIRNELAQSDLDFRRRNDGRLLERVFNVTVYYRAYERQSLDQYRELERFRRAGVRTVGAPPQATE